MSSREHVFKQQFFSSHISLILDQQLYTILSSLSDSCLYSTAPSLHPISLLDILSMRLTLLTCSRFLAHVPVISCVLHLGASVETLLGNSSLLLLSASVERPLDRCLLLIYSLVIDFDEVSRNFWLVPAYSSRVHIRASC